MCKMQNNENGFISYEYLDVSAKKEMASVYVDSYSNFGWSLEGSGSSLHGIGSVNLKFKRDRKIRNKAELGRLQRQFDAGVSRIENLEKSKTVAASIVAYILGLFGTALMAGSVFSYLGGMLPLCIVFAVPAFLGWILPYFCYLGIRKRKTAKVIPLIDQQYDDMYAICEKAHILLADATEPGEVA